MSFPSPPQCLVASSRRCAARLLMVTVELPFLAFHLFGPQQLLCTPGSVTRSACLLLTVTFGDPAFAGPTHVCGQHGLPCESLGILASSPTRPCFCKPMEKFLSRLHSLYALERPALPCRGGIKLGGSPQPHLVLSRVESSVRGRRWSSSAASSRIQAAERVRFSASRAKNACARASSCARRWRTPRS